MTSAEPKGCRICDWAESQESVYSDDRWVAFPSPSLHVPGWFVLALRRHAEGADSMTPEEAATFGPLVSRLTAAIKHVTGVPLVYTYAFGEEDPHWHQLLAARPVEIADQHRGPALLGAAEHYANPAAARAVRTAVRTALAG